MKYSYSNYVEAFSDSYKKVEIDYEYHSSFTIFSFTLVQVE